MNSIKKHFIFLRVLQNIFVLPVSFLNAFCGLITGSECFLFEIAVLGYYAVLICSERLTFWD
jgi:hypothetical protein